MKSHSWRRVISSTKPMRKGRATRLRRAGTLEVLEGRVLLAGDAASAVSPLQNRFNHQDVNHDGRVSATDALLVIHDLMIHGAHPASSATATPFASTGAAPTLSYVDVNGDQRVSAMDALSVIHSLLTTQSVEVNTVFTDLANNPITSIPVGSDFKVHVIGQDVRNPVSDTPGIFSAYLNFMYDPSVVSIAAQVPDPGPQFGLVGGNTNINVSIPGQISSIAVISGAAPQPTNAPEELWSLVVHANSAGSATFAPSLDTTPGNESTVYFATLGEGDILFNQGTITIVGPSSVSIADQSILEGTAGLSSMVFSVSLAAPATQVVTVNYNTVDGTATAGSDYTATSGTLTFQVNDQTKLITVLVQGDTNVEPDETFTVQLSNGVNAEITDGTATGTILNDDSLPTLAMAGVTQAEGNAGTSNFVFTATLSSPSAQPVVVTYATSDGTATAGSDYTATSGTLTFTPGQLSKAITVVVSGDTASETDETFNVALTPISGALANSAVTATGTIVNDEGIRAYVRLQVLDSQGNPVAPGASLNKNSTFTLQGLVRDIAASPTGVFQAFVDVSYDSNFVAVNGPIDHGTVFTVSPSGDTNTPELLNEVGGISPAIGSSNPGGEQVLFNVPFIATGTGLASFGLTLGDAQDHEFLVYLNNDQPVPPDQVDRISTSVAIGANVFNISPASTVEGNSGTQTLVFSVSRFLGTNAPATVVFTTMDGTATAADNDYVPTSGTLTFLPGVANASISVTINGDTTSEIDETFSVVLSNAVGAGIDAGTATGTILNDDSEVGVIAGDASGNEGGHVNFTISLSAPSGQTVLVPFQTSTGGDIPQATAGADYTATSGTLTFAPGVTQQVVSVAISTDQVFEQNEHFLLNLGTPVGASPGPDSVQGTIIDVVPLALLGFATNQFSQPEGSSGTTNFLFTATLSSPTTVPVVVTYTTQNGTATAPSDYVAQSGTFTFAPGETSKVITIAVVGDTVIESNETFSVVLSSTSAPVTGTASPATATATATITNDDGTPLLFISNASAAPGTSNANAVFTVTLSTTATDNVVVGYATQDFTAIANEDYLPQSGNLTFTPGGSLTQFITVPVLGQLSATLDETFFVNLSSVSPNAEIGDAQGVGTIFRQGISVGDVSLLEGDAGTKAAVFTVNLSQPQGHNVTLHYATADGTASAGSDYTAASGDITFTGNDTIKTVTVLINGDTTKEGNETFFLNLSNANGAAIIDGQAVGTIQNDDGTLAHVRLQIGDAQGNPLPQDQPLDPNQNFTLLVYVQDVQLTPTGIFQAFVDVNYDKNLVQFTGPISFGPDFPVPEGADTTTAGLLNEVGAIGPLVPPANPGDEKLFFSAPFKAVNVGLANFTADAGDLPEHDFLEYGRDTAIPPDHLAFDGTSVNIGHNILSVNNISQSESSGDFVFTVTRILPDPNDATVVFHTADGTATAASGDYVPTTGTLTFTAEQTTRTVTVHVNNDTLDEPDETFQLVLSDAVGATASTSPGIATIVDDDGPVVVNIAGATGDEGQNLQFTVTLASVSGQTVIVPFNTASSLSGNIATAGSDYDATSGAVTFAPGVTQQVISVHALNDIVAEPSETFRVVLGQPVNAVVGVGTATGTINDLPPATITGFVYVDLNKNGIKDGSETGIQGVMVTATGANGFSQTVLTDATGAYSFVGLVPGIYTVTETQPGFYTDGRDLHNGVESPVNDSFTNIVLAASATAGGYNFGELGIRSDFVATFLNRRALFATAVVTGEWGPQISTSSTVNPRTGDIWISFDGGWTGMRTIDALFDGTLGTATMTLYDNAKNAVAVSSPSGTGARLQFNGTSGLAYFLRVSGTNPSVQIQFTDSGPTATATAATDTSSTSSGNTNLRAGMLASSTPTATTQAQTSPSATDPVWSEDTDWIGDATV